MIRAVLFDLDGTLLDRNASVHAFLLDHYSRLLQARSTAPFETFRTRFVELDANGYVPKSEVYPQLCQELDLGVEASLLVADFETNFKNACIGFPHLHETLHALRAAGYRLGIITNGGTDAQNRAIDSLQIRNLMDVILVSQMEGMRKPEPAIFRRALGHLAVQPHESVFVGDNPVADVGGARAVGMKAIWKRDDFWPAPDNADATIVDLTELPPLIHRFSEGANLP